MNFLSCWVELRQKRDSYLNASDWTQMSDCPLSDEKKQEWAIYRQLLREIPQRYPDDVDKELINPFNIPDLFPQKPSQVSLQLPQSHSKAESLDDIIWPIQPE